MAGKNTPTKNTSNKTTSDSVNKSTLIDSMADICNLSKADCGKALDAAIEAIFNHLKKGDEVKIAGFGVFHIVERAASTGRNPRTGEEIKIAASSSPKFRALKGFKDAVGK